VSDNSRVQLLELSNSSLLRVSFSLEVISNQFTPRNHRPLLYLLSVSLVNFVDLAVSGVEVLHFDQRRVSRDRQVEELLTHNVVILSVVKSNTLVFALVKEF
jgi:hypothetical protein